MIFYFNHFSLVIFYHSVWLGFELFGLRVRCVVNWCSLRLRTKDMTITIVIINPQTGNGAGAWMTSCPEEMGRELGRFWKKIQLRSDHGVEKLKSDPAVGSRHWTIQADSWVSAIQLWVEDVVGFFGSLLTVILNTTRCATHVWGRIVWSA